MGGRHHQKYMDVKQISKYKAGLRISCRIVQLIKEWHGQIIDGLIFLHETDHPEHEQLSQMINGVVAYVELEHEIVKWTSSVANSLALICNTVHKQLSTHLQYSTQMVQREMAQYNVEWHRSVHAYGVALREMALRDVEQHSAHINGVALREMAQRNVQQHNIHTNRVALREMAQRYVEWYSE